MADFLPDDKSLDVVFTIFSYLSEKCLLTSVLDKEASFGASTTADIFILQVRDFLLS